MINTRIRIEVETEEDGRLLAEVPTFPGVMAYGHTRQEAERKALALVLHVIADWLERGEATPELPGLFVDEDAPKPKTQPPIPSRPQNVPEQNGSGYAPKPRPPIRPMPKCELK